MKNQEIKFKSQNYSILIGKNTINILPSRLKSLCPKTKNIALIIDKKVPNKFRKSLKTKLKSYNLLFLPFFANERNKSLNTINYYFPIVNFLRLAKLKKNKEYKNYKFNFLDNTLYQ